MTAGRPTDYTPELLLRAREYIEVTKDEWEVYTRPTTRDGTIVEIDDVRHKVKLPSIEGLSVYLEVNRDTLYVWGKEHPEFSDILDRIRAIQAETLINKGLSGDYNSTIAKLILTKHGYTDKTDITSGGETINDKAKAKSEKLIGDYLGNQDSNQD